MDSPSLSVHLLGPFKIAVDGSPVSETQWKRRSAKLLVELLALQPHHQLHREEAMEFLWPEADSEAATNSLYKAMHAARRALDPKDTRGHESLFLILRGKQLTLAAPGGLWVDVEAFERLAVEALRSREIHAYQRALEHYRGDLLADEPYEEWATARRDHLRGTRLRLLLGLATVYGSARMFDDAIETLDRLIALDPTSEEACRQAMLVHARIGSPAAALRQFETLRDALRRELDADPDAETLALHRRISTGALDLASPKPHAPADRVAPPTAAASRPGNLPSPTSSFVGREQELAEVKRLLTHTRLLTATGIGGVGKSRFAIRLADDAKENYPGGVWYVELAAIADASFLHKQVATALGVEEKPHQPLGAAIAEWCRPRRALLVLDNCEQLAESVRRLVAETLASCPELRVVVTSRQPLGADGETIWNLAPLATPGPAADATVESLLESDAVRLFLERARQSNPRFSATEGNLRAAAALCHRLDGIPLAIELAAARVRTLSVAQVLARLDGRLHILESSAAPGDRGGTMRAALDWSYGHLLETERLLLRRLAVFSGGWTLEAAESVCALDGLDAGLVLDTLGQLVDKSLVTAAVGERSARYGMLALVREYALEKLERSDELDRVARRHLAWFLRLAEESERRLKGPGQGEWIEMLEAEHDNVRVALARGRGDARTASERLRIAGALAHFWSMRGYWSEGLEWITEALGERSDAGAADAARALHGAGMLAQRLSDLDRSEALFEESLGLSRAAGDGRSAAETLAFLGYVRYRRGDARAARVCLDEALELARSSGDRWVSAFVFNQLGSIALGAGDERAAVAAHERSLALFRQEGDRFRMASALNNCALAETNLGRPQRSATLYEEALELLGQQGDKKTIAIVLNNLGVVTTYQGDAARARAYFERSIEVATVNGDKSALAFALGNLADSLASLGDLGAAERAARESRRLASEAALASVHADSTRALGSILARRGDYDAARELFAEAAGAFEELGDTRGTVQTLEGLAALAAARGDGPGALRLLGATAAARDDLGVPPFPHERAAFEECLRLASANLVDGEVERLVGEGRALATGEALAGALGV